MPVVIERSDWGAQPPNTPWTTHYPKKITIHHTGGRTSGYWQGATTMRAIQDGHIKPTSQGGRGWKDIGYHYVIGPDTSIWRGRPEDKVGAHVRNNNTGNVGISVYGNYNQEDIRQDVYATLVELIADIASRYNIPTQMIFLHRQLQSTDCPGSNLAIRINQIRKDVADVLAGGSAVHAAPVPVAASPAAPVPAPVHHTTVISPRITVARTKEATAAHRRSSAPCSSLRPVPPGAPALQVRRILSMSRSLR